MKHSFLFYRWALAIITLATTSAIFGMQQPPESSQLALQLKGDCMRLQEECRFLVRGPAPDAAHTRQHMYELAQRATTITEQMQALIAPERATRLAVPPHEKEPLINCTYGTPFATHAFLEQIKQRLASVVHETQLSQAEIIQTDGTHTPISAINSQRHQAMAHVKACRANHALHRFFGIIEQHKEAFQPYINTKHVIVHRAIENPVEIYQLCGPVIRKWFNQRAVANWCNRAQPNSVPLPVGNTEEPVEEYDNDILAQKIVGCAQDLYALLVCKNRHLKFHLSNFVDTLSESENTGAELIAAASHAPGPVQSTGENKDQENADTYDTATTPPSGSPEYAHQDILDYGLDLTVWMCITTLRLTQELHPEQAATNTMLQQLFALATGNTEKSKTSTWTAYLNPVKAVKNWGKGYIFGNTIGGIETINSLLTKLHGYSTKHHNSIESISHCSELIKAKRHGSPRARYLQYGSAFTKQLEDMAHHWNQQDAVIHMPLSDELPPEHPLSDPATDQQPSPVTSIEAIDLSGKESADLTEPETDTESYEDPMTEKP